MIIDCISDLHGHYPELEGGDLLIVAGDLTARDTEIEYHQFGTWLLKQTYHEKIVVAGNHDNLLQRMSNPGIADSCYLCDSGTEFEYEKEFPDEVCINGIVPIIKVKSKLKIWGSPWTAAFPGMNPHCMAFTQQYGCDTDEWLSEHWGLIPDDTDILVTHSPPFAMMDAVYDYEAGKIRNCGSKSLHERICKLKLKLHVFGHIHEGYFKRKIGDCTFVNASHVNERYEPVNKPIRIVL
jgi:Icc-related predicted phosphoesterase